MRFCCAIVAGLTKVPIDGQPLSIVQDLEEMCRQYIKVWLATDTEQTRGIILQLGQRQKLQHVCKCRAAAS
jgi:hypothetical protein